MGASLQPSIEDCRDYVIDGVQERDKILIEYLKLYSFN